MKRMHTALVALLLGWSAGTVSGAGLSVTDFEILTRGTMDETGSFGLSSRVFIDMVVEGGGKFSARFKLNFLSSSLEQYLAAMESTSPAWSDPPTPDELAAAIDRQDSLLGIRFQSASIDMTSIFGSPLELSFFVGHFDVFCTGSDFPMAFGTAPFATKLRGFMYFPDGIGGDPGRWYDGIHEVYGTGLRLGLPAAAEWFHPWVYAYQDSLLGTGKYSADLRLQFNFDALKMDFFLGASAPVSSWGAWRCGLLFFYSTGSIGEFYAQIGVPYWNPMVPFGIDQIYFMFEPRLKFGIGALSLTLFYHPEFYKQRPTLEKGTIDINADLMFGRLETSGLQGGAETRISVNPNSGSMPFSVTAAPYLQVLSNGVEWNLKISVRAFPVAEPWYGMFSPYVGVKTSF